MLRFFVSASVLAGLAGCAAPAPVTAPPAAVPAAMQPAMQQGIILAVRPLHAITLLPVRLGWPGTDRQQNGAEFIVKLDDGSTLAVVQQGPSQLHAGQRVGILRGEPTRLVALPQKLAVR